MGRAKRWREEPNGRPVLARFQESIIFQMTANILYATRKAPSRGWSGPVRVCSEMKPAVSGAC